MVWSVHTENLETETSTNTNLTRCVWAHMHVKHGFSYNWKTQIDGLQKRSWKYIDPREEIRGGCWKLYTEELQQDGRNMRHATLGNECKILVLKTEGKRPVMSRLMWEDNFNRSYTNRVKVWIKQHWLGTAVGCATFGYCNNRYQQTINENREDDRFDCITNS